MADGQERQELEKNLRDIDEEFSLGYLTEKGVRKKREFELKLLELDFKEGELTEKGYKRKKEQLEHSEEFCGHAKSVAQSLSSLPSQSKRMSDTIMSLFTNCPPSCSSSGSGQKGRSKSTSKGTTKKGGNGHTAKGTVQKGGKKKLSLPKHKENRFKVLCLPVNSNNIPPHLVKPLLAKAGLINDLVCYSDDSEDIIKERITKLFPTVLSNFSGFDFMSKTANFLEKAKLSCFSARALEGLVDKDDGFIYIIPHIVMKDNPISMALKELWDKASQQHTMSSSTTCVTTTCTSITVTSNTSTTGTSSSSSSSNYSLLVKEAKNPFIGGLILETAGFQQPDLSAFEEMQEDQEEGIKLRNLYAINSEVKMWLSWREQSNKPSLKTYLPNQRYVLCTDDELTDFLTFRDSHRFLQPGDRYLLQLSSLLDAALQSTGTADKVHLTMKYGIQFYEQDMMVLDKVGSWIMMLLPKDNE